MRFWPRNWSRSSWIELMTFMSGRFLARCARWPREGGVVGIVVAGTRRASSVGDCRGFAVLAHR
ncbi:hypothetical protein C7S16_2552 [Burkholderia thailandensis]|uniref:Uncharacterized protein n=1 Tax=Burkholderia thailandensis TaxID=57975 RepID=A0AAW9CWH6_BURTH|nr:hypothetical protein [Burkholderia thailandensis]